MLDLLYNKMDKRGNEKRNIIGNIIHGQVEGDVDCNQHNNFLNLDVNSNEYIKDPSSLLSLQPWIFKVSQNEDNDMGMNGSFSDMCSRNSPKKVSIGCRWGRGRDSLRSRRSSKYIYKHANSVGNCLIPQLYNQQFDFGEYYVSSTHPSNIRPLVITGGNRTIRKYGFDGLSDQLEEDCMISGQTENAAGLPSLPEIRKSVKGKCTLTSPTCQVSCSHDLQSRMLLFCLGISVGILSTIISNRKEIGRLNETLKQTENLVQDLQEELDMKDSLTVKELENETSESNRNDGSYTYMKEFTAVHAKSSEMSRIEAELEAELERLELNMNAASLEGRISTLCEVDPNLISDDVIQGDLGAGQLKPGIEETHDSSNTSKMDIHDVNYAVSPQELSLRLHEVIRSRLEERNKELEAALEESQRQIEIMKTEQIIYQSQAQCLRDLSNSEMGSFSSDPGSPVQPLCLNLDGNALDAYDEACKEFMVSADTKGSRRFRDFSDDSDDNEEEKKLIKQILGKAKEGSHVVMNAQKLFFAMDE